MPNPLAYRMARELAGMEDRGGGVVSYNPVSQVRQRQQQQGLAQRRATRPASTNAGAAAVVAARGGGGRQDDGGGVLGKLLNNPIGRGVTGALSAVDVFRRIGVLGAEEGAKRLPDWMKPDMSDGFQAGDLASLAIPTGGFGAIAGLIDEDRIDEGRSNLDKIGDSSYGFGDIAHSTGNKWADRAVGFVGDVALDPLTYVTFGAGKFAGASGRAAAATRVAEAGLDASNIGRRGVMGANAAERAAIFGAGSADAAPGLRFMGQRIPGTGRVAESTGGALSSFGARVGDTKLPSKLRELRYEKGYEDAYRALRAGDGGANAAAAMLAGRTAAKAERGLFSNQYQTVLDKLARDTDKTGRGREIFNALDQGAPLDDIGQRYREFFDDTFQQQVDAGVNVTRRQNFVPHQYTDDAVTALKGEQWTDVRKALGVDLTKAKGSTLARQIQPDKPFILPDGSTVTFTADTASGAVSAEQINRVLAPKLGVDKVIEDDIARVLKPYVDSTAQQVGEAARIQRVGSIAGVDESAGTRQVVDRQATDALYAPDRARVDRDLGRAENFQDFKSDSLARQGKQAQDYMTRKLQEIVDGGDEFTDAAVGQLALDLDDVPQKVTLARDALTNLKRLQVNPRANKQTAAAFGQIERDLADAAGALGTYEGSEYVASLMSTYAKGVAELGDNEAQAAGLRLLQKELKSGNMIPVLKTQMIEGFKRLGDDLVGDSAPIVREEVARMLTNFNTAANDPQFFKVIDNYTRFFKTYATTSPGFHVRNGMGATFMNAADGVSVQNMGRGVSLWRKYVKNPQGWTDELPSWIDKDQAEDALRSVLASGGGEGQFGRAELRLKDASVITNNRVTRLSQRAGGAVEGMARMGMALDTILGGGTVDEAAARITRIQFDYSATSQFDDMTKRIIPFWTFMSRNVPLQIQQMAMKPRVYQQYRSLVRNMGEDYENDLVPLWMQEGGAFKVTDGVYGMPDFAHLGVEKDLEQFTTRPAGLLESLNPALRVPAELVAGKQFFGDREFRENGLTEATDGLGFLDLLGLTDTAGDGSEVVDERLAYALRSLAPPLSTYQRLAGGEERLDDRRLQTIANYLGLPIKTLTPGQQDSERRRRERESENAGRSEEARRRALLEFASSQV